VPSTRAQTSFASSGSSQTNQLKVFSIREMAAGDGGGRRTASMMRRVRPVWRPCPGYDGARGF
jgi:hypothetical protein